MKSLAKGLSSSPCSSMSSKKKLIVSRSARCSANFFSNLESMCQYLSVSRKILKRVDGGECMQTYITAILVSRKFCPFISSLHRVLSPFFAALNVIIYCFFAVDFYCSYIDDVIMHPSSWACGWASSNHKSKK